MTPSPHPRLRRRRSSLTWRLVAVACALIAVAIAVAIGLEVWLGEPLVAGAVAFAVVVPVAISAIRRPLAPVTAMFRALEGTVTSYRDGDFSFALRWDGDDELADLVGAHNDLGAALRDQRLGLVQRELLLDTMVQHTPVAMLLVTGADRIVYANLAARRLLHGGRKLEGHALSAIVAGAPEPLREAIARGGDGLFTTGTEDDEEVYHLARSGFRLNGRSHELFVLRHLTVELHRQEVRTWKKVIRVISHELNNSLAPVASLAHSGAELVRRGQHDRLDQVFATIADRARHLDEFIRGYAQFAKLPAPRLEDVAWAPFLAGLRDQVAFTLAPPPADWIGRFDPAQIEQAALNLVKNAHESGSPPADIEVRLAREPGWVRLEVLDRGSGMTETVLSNALLPFYSTKREGTGLGLALVREIAEAHGGRVALANRPGGGLTVTITIPQ